MKVSVIIPCHNESAHLAEQLDALAAQQYDGAWDVIVVDHRSTDRTAEVASAHVPLRDHLNGYSVRQTIILHATEQRQLAHR